MLKIRRQKDSNVAVEFNSSAWLTADARCHWSILGRSHGKECPLPAIEFGWLFE
jgi:hypothetical protein